MHDLPRSVRAKFSGCIASDKTLQQAYRNAVKSYSVRKMTEGNWRRDEVAIMDSKIKKRPILVVDDEPEMLRSLRNLLRLEFEVHVAASGTEGMQILQKHPVHVVMTDQRMPQMTGVEFLSQAKAWDPEMVRVIFTGYTETSALIDAINQGNVFRYVAKPWDPDALVAILREAGEQHDRLFERRQLLSDLRAHGEKFLAFTEHLRSEHDVARALDSMAQMEQLSQSTRSLLDRLVAALTPLNAGSGF